MTELQDTPDMAELRKNLRDLHYSVELNHQKQQSPRISIHSLGQRPLQLPTLQVCEKLAVLYFDNMEHCFRILHWPEFKDQLRLLFAEGEHACKFGYLPQLIGVLASAVLLDTHQECEAAKTCLTIRPAEALRYMEDFLQGLRDNERYRLPALQVKMLLLISKWLNLGPMDDLFRLNGEILRDALVMRMHHDPVTLPRISVFECELRRRYWMTIVEVDLMLSILCKMPCMVPPYSTKPPQNVNDEEIFEDMETLPVSRPTMDWTDGLCQYLLAQSFPHRLAACKEMDNAIHFKSDDVLQHTRHLERVLQELPPPLRFNYLGDEASKTPARLMARMELDISIRRPLMHLYSRCVLALDAKDVDGEARAGLLQSCLMLTNYQDLFDPLYSELDVPRPQGYWNFFYTCYRQELGQAILGLCLEIKNLNDSPLTGASTPTNAVHSPSSPPERVMRIPSYTRSNLIHAVKDALEPMTRRLPHRAAKVQDIVYYNILSASLVPETPGQDRGTAIKERLQELLDESRAALERAHVPLIAAPASGLSSEQAAGKSANTFNSFDPLWDGFQHIGTFEPFELDIPAMITTT